MRQDLHWFHPNLARPALSAIIAQGDVVTSKGRTIRRLKARHRARIREASQRRIRGKGGKGGRQADEGAAPDIDEFKSRAKEVLEPAELARTSSGSAARPPLHREGVLRHLRRRRKERGRDQAGACQRREFDARMGCGEGTGRATPQNAVCRAAERPAEALSAEKHIII